MLQWPALLFKKHLIRCFPAEAASLLMPVSCNLLQYLVETSSSYVEKYELDVSDSLMHILCVTNCSTWCNGGSCEHRRERSERVRGPTWLAEIHNHPANLPLCRFPQYLVKWKHYELDVGDWSAYADLAEMSVLDMWEREHPPPQGAGNPPPPLPFKSTPKGGPASPCEPCACPSLFWAPNT